jgi:hypothetical protein
MSHVVRNRNTYKGRSLTEGPHSSGYPQLQLTSTAPEMAQGIIQVCVASNIFRAFNFSSMSSHNNFEYVFGIWAYHSSRAWTVFARLNIGIVGSNPTWSMDVFVRLFCVYVILCVGSGLAMGWSSVQGILPTVYRIMKLKNRPRSNKRTVEP